MVKLSLRLQIEKMVSKKWGVKKLLIEREDGSVTEKWEVIGKPMLTKVHSTVLKNYYKQLQQL